MPRFPVYGPPFQYYRPYNYNYRPRTPIPEPVQPHIQAPEEPPKLERSSHQKSKPDTPVWLDLFGIKLYFDDVLIRENGIFVHPDLLGLNPENFN